MGDKMEKTASPASPCVGLCRIDEPSGLCAGCARSLDEIAAWSAMGAAARGRVSALLPARRAALGLPPHPIDLPR